MGISKKFTKEVKMSVCITDKDTSLDSKYIIDY